MRLVLASASPARLALMRAAGLDPEVVVSEVDEDALTLTLNATPAELALVLAEHKGADVAARLEATAAPTLIVACDSVLELDGVAYGKPTSPEDAVARWHGMRGREGVLHTGHSITVITPRTSGAETHELSRLASAQVRFGRPTDVEIEAYVATGEPLRVAGAFTLDRLGGWFVDGIDGDPGTVLGLSLPLLREMVSELGLDVPTLWRHANGSPP